MADQRDCSRAAGVGQNKRRRDSLGKSNHIGYRERRGVQEEDEDEKKGR